MQLVATLILWILSSGACPEHFWHGREPVVLHPGGHDQVLCSQAFAVYHSGATLTPLWSAEHLTAASVQSARGMERENDFHEDDRLPDRFRSWLRDYRGGPYDRGHLSPSGDMPNASAQFESFALSNMTPQDRDNNRGIWERIERATRLLAVDEGELYVITGPIFLSSRPPRFDGRVRVPDQIWKLLYDPRVNAVAAYLCENAPGDSYNQVDVAQLEALTGLKFDFGRAGVLQLPKPKRRKSRDQF